ncbi:hypothetical protein Trydic_g6553 [Trypoxylus dichotomus]
MVSATTRKYLESVPPYLGEIEIVHVKLSVSAGKLLRDIPSTGNQGVTVKEDVDKVDARKRKQQEEGPYEANNEQHYPEKS